jgi:hypothetical protein
LKRNYYLKVGYNIGAKCNTFHGGVLQEIFKFVRSVRSTEKMSVAGSTDKGNELGK